MSSFLYVGEIPNFLDALFEIVSGFTTTGASILSNVEGLSKGMLYWRSFSHWLGGMGVLVFLLAVGERGDKGSGFTLHLLRAESPGPTVGKLVPKMRTTARILYMMYILLTILNIIFLLFGGMSLLKRYVRRWVRQVPEDLVSKTTVSPGTARISRMYVLYLCCFWCKLRLLLSPYDQACQSGI